VRKLDAISLLVYLSIAFMVLVAFFMLLAFFKAMFSRKAQRRPRVGQAPPTQSENLDPSVYFDDPEATQEDDMEEDLGLLDDEDDLW
jgi:hypothetical protein